MLNWFPDLRFIFLGATGLLGLSAGQSYADGLSMPVQAFIDGQSGEDALQSAELRLMPQARLAQTGVVTLHYILGLRYEQDPDFAGGGLPFMLDSEKRRLLDLQSDLASGSHLQLQHRIDRLSYRHSAGWGSLTLGREAVTWGNGLVFNPMDLFNPFSPSDVERDFKQGDDLLWLTINPADWNQQVETQWLLVPRRDPVSGRLRQDQSSAALKLRFSGSGAEWDLLAAMHYGQTILGLGRSAQAGDAIWRWDATLAFGGGEETVFSSVLNIDRSWVWSGLNTYGSFELFYTTAGTQDYAKLFSRTQLTQRLGRGELFSLGRLYAAPSLQIELHPLLNLHLLAILNLQDSSASLIPRLVWSATQSVSISLTAHIPVGREGTEFGGFRPDGSPLALEPSALLRLRVEAWF